MFCSTLGTGAPAPSPRNGGSSGPAIVTTNGDITPILALSLSDDTPPLPSSRQSNVVLLAEVPGLLSGESLAEVVEVRLFVLGACLVEIVEGLVMVGAAEE